MFQFLVEAATLTLLGGAVGMLLGGGVAWLVNKFTPIPATIPIWSVVVAITASVVTGVFFGLYPASKASGWIRSRRCDTSRVGQGMPVRPGRRIGGWVG